MDSPPTPVDVPLARHRSSVAWLALGLSVVALLVVGPLASPIILGAWFATLARTPLLALSRALGGRRRASALLTIALMLAVLLPGVLVGKQLVEGAGEILSAVRGSKTGRAALEAVVAQDGAKKAAPSSTPVAQLAVGDAKQVVQVCRPRRCSASATPSSRPVAASSPASG